MLLRSFVQTLIALALLSTSLPAAVVISNLDSTSGNSFFANSNRYLAQAFKTPATGAFEVTKVTLNLAAANNTGGGFFVAVYEGDSQPTIRVPGGLLAGSANPATAGRYSYTADGLVLLPSKVYWLVAGVTQGAGQYRWFAATTATYQTSVFTADARFAQYTPSTTTWVVGSGGTPNMFSMEAEPTQLLLLIEKGQRFEQTSSAVPTVSASSIPFSFGAVAERTPPITLTIPTGETLSLPEAGLGFGLERSFPTKAALDAAFPGGTYQMSGSNLGPFSFALAPEAYPAAAPQVVGGVWNGAGLLIVDPTRDATLQFNAFTEYGAPGLASVMTLDLEGLTDSVYLEGNASTLVLNGRPASATPFTQFTIPANSLTAGRTYQCDVRWTTAKNVDAASIPGTLVGTLFWKHTTFFVVAQAGALGAAPPVIATPPASQTKAVGGSVTFAAGVTVGGSSQLSQVTLRWYHNGSEIEADGSKYTIAPDGLSLTVKSLDATDAGSYVLRAIGAGGVATSSPASLVVTAVTSQTGAQVVSPGQPVTLSVVPASEGPSTLQWNRNGTAIPGATQGSLTLANLQPAEVGIYSATVGVSGSSASGPGIIVGLANTAKVLPLMPEFPDIVHPATGFVYDQLLLAGPAATVTADSGQNQITRISFVDLSNDIVQVEFAGPGTLSIVLDTPSGPALPVNYNQNVTYMKGHAGIVITGATETTNLSIFSVGKLVNTNPALYLSSVTYDGFADLAFVAISSPTGKFGGLRAGNAHFLASKGFTGVYAPGVQIADRLIVSDITAAGTATPVLIIGSGNDTRVTGGDLLQANGRAVLVKGVAQLRFEAGTSSHGLPVAAQNNQAQLVDSQTGADVTQAIVVNPVP